jgi:hypothetical protein
MTTLSETIKVKNIIFNLILFKNLMLERQQVVKYRK